MSDPRVMFRRAKKRALNTILQPAGFELGRHMFVRRVSGQHHAVEFQPSKNGDEYFVNLAFSYDFLPPFFHGGNGQFIALADYVELDFLLSSRLGHFLPGPYQDDWRYDDLAVGDVAEQVERNAQAAVSVLDAAAKQWAHPGGFLERLPPHLLAEDRRLRLERYRAMQANLPWADRPFPITQAIGNGWEADGFNLSFACAMVAWRSGRKTQAKEYLRVATSDVEPFKREILERLCNHVGLPLGIS